MEKLNYGLSSYGLPIHLVFDGSAIPKIESLLQSVGLKANPLFFGSHSMSGPWLVTVMKPYKELGAYLKLGQRYEAGVCWVADCTTKDIVKHLRGLNQVSFSDETLGYFRHYDPEALSWLIEKLNAQQASRLFGPAVAIGMVSGFARGSIVDKPEGLPPPEPGFLVITDDQADMLQAKNENESRGKLIKYLRFSNCQIVADHSDEQLLDFVKKQEEARKHDLNSEYHFAMWLYVVGNCQGRYPIDRELADEIRRY